MNAMYAAITPSNAITAGVANNNLYKVSCLDSIVVTLFSNDEM